MNSLTHEAYVDDRGIPPLATVGPSRAYWISLCTHSPFLAFGLTAVFFAWKGDPVESLFHPSFGMFLWIAGTVCFAGWFAIRAPHTMTWTLTETSLRQGKYGRGVVILFDEIESIVIGLPDLSPLLKFSRNYVQMARDRKRAFFVRLRGRRVIQLTFVTFHYRGGEKLMEEFLRLNFAKVVGRATYTPDELRKFSRTGVNRIVRV
ncbi:MAG TPA: hypothetical protein VIS99_17465 [Terrimicrobiaceae bacterium]